MKTQQVETYTPATLAARWHMHPESLRRMIRDKRMSVIKLGRRNLITAAEVARIERDGFQRKDSDTF